MPIANFRKWKESQDWVALQRVLTEHLPEEVIEELTRKYTIKEPVKTVTIEGVTYNLPRVGDELFSEGQLKIGSFAGSFKGQNDHKITLIALKEAIRHYERLCITGTSPYLEKQFLEQVRHPS